MQSPPTKSSTSRPTARRSSTTCATGPPNFWAPNSKKVFDYRFTPDGGHRPYFINRPVAEWSEWAAKNGVPMDKLYATEHREGGAIALGKNIPYLPHDKLNVLPESEWQTQKQNFILETWLERVRQASSSHP